MSEEKKKYEADDILKTLEVYKTTSCFAFGKIPLNSKFWDMRRDVGKDKFKEEYGVSIGKDAEHGWYAKVRVGTCQRNRTQFEHGVKKGDCVWITELPQKKVELMPVGFNPLGMVTEVRDDGKVRAKNIISGVYEDYIDHENWFVPIYEDGDISKGVKYKELSDEDIRHFKYWHGALPLSNKCYEVSYRNKNKKLH